MVIEMVLFYDSWIIEPDKWAERGIVQTSYIRCSRYKKRYLLFTTDATIGPPESALEDNFLYDDSRCNERS